MNPLSIKGVMMINWQYYPKSYEIIAELKNVVEVFKKNEKSINLKDNKLVSNEVLSLLRADLVFLGFLVEKGKKATDKIKVSVLFGKNGAVEKHFEADAYNANQNIVLEVEAGRGLLNNQFLKDLFQACVMVDVDYCAIAVKNIYGKK